MQNESKLTDDVEFVADEEGKAGVAGSGHGGQGLPAISDHVVAQHVVLGVGVNGHSSHHYHLVICTHQPQVHIYTAHVTGVAYSLSVVISNQVFCRVSPSGCFIN